MVGWSFRDDDVVEVQAVALLLCSQRRLANVSVGEPPTMGFRHQVPRAALWRVYSARDTRRRI